MMNLTTLSLSFWDYALEIATHILKMVPTKKVEKTPYELWYKKVPNLSYLKVWGCEALVKRDTPDKLQQRSVKCIFIGYPKETMGYYFYFLPENKIIVARYVEFLEKNLLSQENFLANSLEENDKCEDLQLQATTNFKADHVDAYDLDCDDEVATNIIFMENLSPIGSINDDIVERRYDSDILSEVPHYDTYHESDMLNSNVQEMEYIENIVFNNESYDELTSNINVISYAEYMVTIGNDTDNYVPLPVENNDMILSETLILAEDSRLKMIEKQTQVKAKPIDYAKLNKLYEDFVLQKQLSAEQLYCKFDDSIERRTTLFPYEIGSWKQSDIKWDFKQDVIPFSEDLKETFKLFKKGLIAEVKEMKDTFKQMDDEVDQCSMAKKYFEI
nr:retrotransposon protein, putative, Ty1-copia subclass [Tanacetum cinerariifolium]